MRLRETARMALEAVRLNRLRSALTILGIMIGIASVTLTVGLGLGAQQQVTAQIESLGSNLLIVTPGSQTSGGVRGGFGTATTLTRADAVVLASPDVAPDVAAVAPTVTSSQNVTSSSTNWTTSVVAATPEWLGVRARTLAEGRFITAADVTAQDRVIVLGPTTANELFPGDPLGQTVTMDGGEFTVIGVLNSIGASGASSSEDDTILMPWTTASAAIGSSAATVQSIFIQAKDSSSLSAAYQEVSAALATRHTLSSSGTTDFTVTSQQSIVQAATTTTQILTLLLGGIAGISLLVGGIGVMNIMLVSVSERIREIGLRKALGAKPRVIRSQFLTEAAILGLAGGVAGLVLALLGGLVLSSLINMPVALSWWAVAGSLAVAVGVGLIAGVYPAGRAARLAPIDALRRE